MKYSLYIILAYSLGVQAELNNVLDSTHGLPGDSIKSGSGEAGIKTFFSSVVTMFQDITAISAVLGICIVGIMYIMSAGDEEKTETAKKYLIAIFIGIGLAFTAWSIISMIDLIPNSLSF